jgi:hypothetical protein
LGCGEAAQIRNYDSPRTSGNAVANGIKLTSIIRKTMEQNDGIA